MLLASFSLSLQSNFSAHIGLVWRIFALPFCTTITPHVCQLNAARNAFQTENQFGASPGQLNRFAGHKTGLISILARWNNWRGDLSKRESISPSDMPETVRIPLAFSESLEIETAKTGRACLHKRA
jgi:hypothetical protein